ncbi:MAG: SDR family NAD(P)-dependent oxidoreductase [Methanomassiliicoccaceae archaeon]|jgi:short-subunit dehydrogenase|nr:SDR family NAD(P)-dependent oxidoreductase [Methanomassiliicoccaceae archaeon]
MAVIITGASKGIGFALAGRMASAGHIVYSFSRTAPADTRIRHIPCDVSDTKSVDDAFREFFEKETDIDILVNNAGIGISGASEYADEDDIKKIFGVNFHGAVRCSQRAVPRMREQGRGKIIFISSAAAVFPIPFQSFYTATKSAVSAFAEGLRMELRPFGIQVGTVLLCDTRTEFTANRKKNVSGEEFYGNRIEHSVSIMENDEQNGMSAERAAERISSYLERKRTRSCKAVGSQFRVPLPVLLFLNRILPRGTVLGILYRIYGK